MSAPIIERDGKPEYAVIPYDVYQAMVERLEDLEDIRAADEAIAELERGENELIPWEMSERLSEGENPIRLWREHRSVTQAELAEAAGVRKPAISQIEAGKRQPSVPVLSAIAQRLGVDMDDLVPAAKDED